MPAGQRLTTAFAAAALSFSTLVVATPAGAAADPGASRPDSPVEISDVQVRTPPLVTATALVSSERGVGGLTSARSSRRPLFAFWGKRYNRIDGFSFATAHRGSGTPLRVDVAWKRMRSGLQPVTPKVFTQRRIDVKSDPVTVRYENQTMYTGDALRFYQPIASLCPNAVVTIDQSNITEENDAIFDWQYGISMDAVSLALQNNAEEENLAIAVHECAHMKQFYNWGGTRQAWSRLIKRSDEVFVADNSPDPNVATPPMRPGWAPLEHAADCATLIIYPSNLRTYGGYCNPAETASAALLWQNARY